jgi:hypothetical protein
MMPELTDAELIEYDAILAKMIRIGDYHKTKMHLLSINEQLDALELIPDDSKPRNAREDSIQFHNKVKKVALEKQRERAIKKMSLLEEDIKKDMESKK